MRVLRADSIHSPEGLSFATLNDSDEEPYAILSHTWGTGEVLFEHVVNGTAASMPAYPKVRYACQQALNDGWEYVWIDTCCIEKSSSAELSEAINSMFRWYQDAVVCYAYLSDYESELSTPLEESQWFTRGWTLQELIAPNHVVFYGAGWFQIGTKNSLKSPISKITNIAAEILEGTRPIETASIANRMGWASHRVTTRKEDIAYCLMGLFDISMPLLYGEGKKAFLRLQEEILKTTTDHTLFAWVDGNIPDDEEHGLLAPSPSCFTTTRSLVPYEGTHWMNPISMQNGGLSISLRLAIAGDGSGAFLGVLDCPTPDYEEDCHMCVYLQKNEHRGGYSRIRVRELASRQLNHTAKIPPLQYERLLIRPWPKGMLAETDRVCPSHYLRLVEYFPGNVYECIDAWPAGMPIKAPGSHSTYGPGNNESTLIRRLPGRLTTAVVFQRGADQKRILVTIGSRDELRLGFYATEFDETRVPRAEMEDAKMLFAPMGEVMEMANHRVRVTAQSQINGSRKYYKAIVVIEAKGLPAAAARVVPVREAVQDERGEEDKSRFGRLLSSVLPNK